MDTNLEKDIKKESLEENNDHKKENKNISDNEINYGKDSDGNKNIKNENFEILVDKNNDINNNNNFMFKQSILDVCYNNMNYSMNQQMNQMGMRMIPAGFLSPGELEYYNFCRDLYFIHNNQITVKVNQKFAERFENNYTIPPEFWKDIPSIQSKSEAIKLIETRTFYPHPIGLSGGDHVTLVVLKQQKR